MLSMQEKFTPPLKKSNQIVPDSDENSSSEYGNYDNNESVDDDDFLFATTKRILPVEGSACECECYVY
jgi:hypothetical protein